MVNKMRNDSRTSNVSRPSFRVICEYVGRLVYEGPDSEPCYLDSRPGRRGPRVVYKRVTEPEILEKIGEPQSLRA